MQSDGNEFRQSFSLLSFLLIFYMLRSWFWWCHYNKKTSVQENPELTELLMACTIILDCETPHLLSWTAVLTTTATLWLKYVTSPYDHTSWFQPFMILILSLLQENPCCIGWLVYFITFYFRSVIHQKCAQPVTLWCHNKVVTTYSHIKPQYSHTGFLSDCVVLQLCRSYLLQNAGWVSLNQL